MKLTGFLAVDPGVSQITPYLNGSIEKLRQWVGVLRNHGTTVDVFHNFVYSI